MWRIRCRWSWQGPALDGAVTRYAWLARVGGAAARHGARLIAFGLGDGELRLVVAGAPAAIAHVMRAFRCGANAEARRWGAAIRWRRAEKRLLLAGELLDALAWAHRAPVDAGEPALLASPWSSLRDWLGYRRAPFFDADAAAAALAPDVPARLRAEAPPRRAQRPAAPSLDGLLRVAAAVCGVLPTDRRCWRLFAQLAREHGHGTAIIARRLGLTPRRVRQLVAAGDADRLPAARATLGDAELSRVP